MTCGGCFLKGSSWAVEELQKEPWLSKLHLVECAMGMRRGSPPFPTVSAMGAYPEQSESTEQLGEVGEVREWEENQIVNHHRYFCCHFLATASSLVSIQKLH